MRKNPKLVSVLSNDDRRALERVRKTLLGHPPEAGSVKVDPKAETKVIRK